MKHNISKRQMIDEYVKMGKFDVITYDKETKKRIGTYAGLDAHKAFAEALKRINHGSLFLVVQWPKEMKYTEMFDLEQNYETAKKYAASIDFDFLGR